MDRDDITQQDYLEDDYSHIKPEDVEEIPPISAEDISQMDIATLCSKKTIERIFYKTNFEQEELLEVAGARAEELSKGKKAYLNKLVRAYKEDRKEGKLSNEVESAYTIFFEGKKLEFLTGEWWVSKNGVRKYDAFNKSYVYACRTPIVIARRLTDIETQEEKVVLLWKKDGAKHTLTVRKDVIADHRLVNKLSQYGVGVTSTTAKNLVEYFASLEAENKDTIDIRLSTKKLGWSGNQKLGSFVPYCEKSILFDAGAEFKPLGESIREKGSQDAWMKLALDLRKRTAKHYEPQLCISAALGSALMQPLELSPFILNVWGGTGKGKTVTIMLACSVWANPGGNGYLTDALTTKTALETRLDILNSLPLFVDDFSKVEYRAAGRNADPIADMIYLICSGRGKDRSNKDLGLDPIKTWRNITIANKETPLTADNAKGGQINRVLDFESMDGDIFQDPKTVVSVIGKNYGFTGKAFVEAVKGLGIEKLTRIHEKAKEAIQEEADRQGLKIESKQMIALSVILTADRIATNHIFKDGIYLDLKTCVQRLKTSDDVQETRRVYENVMDWVDANIARFEPVNEPFDDAYTGPILGRMDRENGYVHIIPNEFKKWAREQNFSTEAFLKWADSAGILKRNDNKLQNVVRVKDRDGKTKLKRFYTLKLEDLGEVGDSFTTTGAEDAEQIFNG